MNEETARAVVNAVTAFDPLIGTLSEAIDDVGDENLRSQFKRAVGDVMGVLFSEIMHPLEKIYPSLIPESEM